MNDLAHADFGHQVLQFWRGQRIQPRLHSRFFGGRTKHAEHRPKFPHVAGDGTGVDGFDARDAVVAQEFIHRANAVAVVRLLHRVSDDHATRPHAPGLGTSVVNTVISDERVGEGQHLPREGGVREGFLEAHHARGEDELALTDALCAEEATTVALAVGGQEQAWAGGARRCFAMCEDVSRIGKSGLVRTFPRHHRLARPDFNNDWGQNLA